MFQDNSEHIYQIPTVRIQNYSLEEISEKHLTLFLPYTILRFRIRKNQKKKFTKKELTEHLEKVILILEEEVSAGNLTPMQYHDYAKLIQHVAERVFAGQKELWREVSDVTERLIRLPSDEYREMKEKYETELARKEDELVRQEDELARQKEENARLAAENRRLQERLKLAEMD
ncbi:MAG: hypothetical protein NC433_05665 [Clostridiales bacterium]|nr:hypothetical protein [Clostridiales bacterium]